MRQGWLLLAALLVNACHGLRIEFKEGTPFAAGTVVGSLAVRLNLDSGENWDVYSNDPARIEIAFPADQGFVIDKTQLNPELYTSAFVGYEIRPELNLDTPNEIRFVGGRASRFGGLNEYVQVGCSRCFQFPELPSDAQPLAISGIQVIMRKSNGDVAAANYNVTMTVQSVASLQSTLPALEADSADTIALTINTVRAKYAGSDLVVQLNDLIADSGATPSLTTNPDYGVAAYDANKNTLTISNIPTMDVNSQFTLSISGVKVPFATSLSLLVAFTESGDPGLFGSFSFTVNPKRVTAGSITLDPPFAGAYSRLTLSYKPSVALPQGSFIKIFFPNGYLQDSAVGALTVVTSHPDISSVEKNGPQGYVKFNIGKDIAAEEVISVTVDGVATTDNGYSEYLDTFHADAFTPANGDMVVNTFYPGPALLSTPATNDPNGLQITGFSASYSNKKYSDALTTQRNAATLQFTTSYALKKGSGIRLRFPESSFVTIADDASFDQFPNAYLETCASGPFTCYPGFGVRLTDHLPRGTYTLVLDGIINPMVNADLSGMYVEFLGSTGGVLVTVPTSYTLEHDDDGGNAGAMISVSGIATLLSLCFAFLLVAY